MREGGCCEKRNSHGVIQQYVLYEHACTCTCTCIIMLVAAKLCTQGNSNY